MIFKILGMEKIKYKCEADKIKAVGFATQGLVEAGKVACGIAADFPFQRPTGALAIRYRLSIEEPLKVALYNVAVRGYWRFVEYGTGIYSTLGTGRQTPWLYVIKSGPWAGGHWTRGQKPKMMLNNAVKDNLVKLSLIVRDKIKDGLIHGT